MSDFLKIVAQNDDEADVLMYGAIGRWEELRASRVAQIFAELKGRGYKKVTLRVHSPGGDVYEGLALYGLIQNSGLETVVSIEGVAASMMSLVMLGATKRVMNDSSRVMIHQPRATASGTATKLKTASELVAGLRDQMAQLYAERTGKTKEYVLTNFMKEDEDVWFTADQALEAGLIDEIKKSPSKEKSPEGSFSEVVAYYDELLCEAKSTDTDTNFQNKLYNQMLIKKLQAFAVGLGCEVTANADESTLLNAVEQKIKAMQSEIHCLKKQANEAKLSELKAAMTHVPVAVQEKYIAMAGKVGVEEVIVLVKESFPAKRDLLSEIAANQAKPNAVQGGEALHPEGKSKAQWSLQEWEQYDPSGLKVQMRDNPDWYAEAFQKEYGYSI